MKHRIRNHRIRKKCTVWAAALAAAPLALLFGLVCALPAMAEPSGHLDWANRYTIAGWSWDEASPEETMEVTIAITPAGSQEAVKTLTVPAETYRGDLVSGANDGNHGFFCPIDWSQLSGDSFTVTAYVQSGEQKFPLTGTIFYNTSSEEPILAVLDDAAADSGSQVSDGAADSSSSGGTLSAGEAQAASESKDSGNVIIANVSSRIAAGSSASSSGGTLSADGSQSGSASEATDNSSSGDTTDASGWKRGTSLGYFITTGYCNCLICSGGSNLTYSGTVPQPNHTISADLNIFPIGTKLMIGDIVYTVEDKGSEVRSNNIDIFYSTHEEAVAHGQQTMEVFAVIAE